MDPAAIEALIEKGRDSYEARLAAGQARLAQGDLEQAIAHFRRATEFRDDRAAVWQFLGKALNTHGEPEAARGVWEHGLEVAREQGDKQSEKVMTAWLKRLDR